MKMVGLPVNFVKFLIRSKHLLLLVAVAMSIAALSFAVPRFALPRASGNDLNSAKPKNQNCCGDQPITLRRMIGAYYRADGNWKSTLILNNKGGDPITVTPTLYSQSGQSFTSPAISVAGLSPLEVDLNALAKTAGPQFKEGSIEFSYTGKLLEMGGGLTIVDAERSLAFDEQMLEPGMKFSTPRLESVFAIPYESAQVDLILTNTTANLLVIDGQATFVGNSVKFPIQFVLAPHQSQRFTMPHGLIKRAKAGAVSLQHNGDKGALMAALHIREERKGFSATVNFSNYAKGRTTSLHGAGLRLGNINGDAIKPVVVVRNTDENPTTITAKVPYTKTGGDAGIVVLPQLTLGPGEIGFLDTSNPQLRKSDFDAAGLEVEYTGIPGSVIATAYSVSASGNHIFSLPMKDPKGGLSSTGGYPWFINETSSTMVFIKNTTTEPQRFTLDIIYPGGQWGSNLRTLDPGQTFKLDVREVRDSQMKGSEGNVIPLDATMGHVSWSAKGKDSHKTLIGRSQTVDIAKGLVSTYECQRCCGDSLGGSRVIPGVITEFVGYTEQFLAQEQDWDCYHEHLSSWYNVGWATWGSNNTNVMTVDSSGLGTGVGAGAASIWASWPGTYWFADDAQGCMPQEVGAGGQAECTVADVTISGPKTCMDGGSADFSVTVTGAQAQSFQWSFTAPSGVGNNPNVSFGSPSSADTTTDCHWFAKPNQECSNGTPSSTDPYYNSVYTIKCAVTISGGQVKNKETTLTVNAFWALAGGTPPPPITGGPTYGFNTATQMWVVTGPGNLARGTPSPIINIPSSSQFHSKTVAHENKHVAQYQTGMLSDLYTVPSLMMALSPLTDAMESGLVTKINNASMSWAEGQHAIRNSRTNAFEREAYDVSDPIAPRYAYQRCGRFQ